MPFISNSPPKDVAANVRRYIAGEPMRPMAPWYKGFEGEVVPAGAGGESFAVFGQVREIDEETVAITELPLRKWTTDYKDFLEVRLYTHLHMYTYTHTRTLTLTHVHLHIYTYTHTLSLTR